MALAGLLLVLAICGTAMAADFRFANYYGDHMVLQRGPRSASVWGYVPDCSPVTVTFNGKTYAATLVPDATPGMCRWVATLTPTTDIGPYTISASSGGGGKITLSDVLFGDVWMCSGQSNMQFTLPQVYNASEEIEKAAKYPHVRLFTAALKSSDTPQEELIEVEEPWAVASAKSVNGSAWGYFSAVCWLFGRDLYDHLQYPIGLVDADWGGTRVEAWSSPDALSKCYPSIEKSRGRTRAEDPNPNNKSVLWNAMIHPFLNMTIYGAIWYQGEANAGYTNYNCTFPAMIDDWREKWFKSSRGQTNILFPFGFVQLAADGNSNATVGGFPTIRWAQTADYGYVPNRRMKKVFMAVAMDLGDPNSPYGSVHPRDKQDVGARLVLSGRAVAYGDTSVYYTGPLARESKLRMTKDPALVELTITYINVAPNSGLELRYPYGFELGCSTTTSATVQWIEGTAIKADNDTVTVQMPSCPSGGKPSMLRYCWRTDPCTFKKCPIYSGDLPSPPFIMPLS